jgi:anti-sigma-K factor RskA
MAELPIPDAERDALAAELALGLLSADARAEALRLRLSDPAFAAAVAAWEVRFAGLTDEIAPVTPPAGLWDQISARLPGDAAPVIATLADGRGGRGDAGGGAGAGAAGKAAAARAAAGAGADRRRSRRTLGARPL